MTILHSGFTHIEFRGAATLIPPSYTTEDDAYVEQVAQPVEMISSRDAILDPSLMDVNRPYGYTLDGIEHVAIRRDNGQLDFYEVPTR